ncbi:unnamed protein product, partial [Acanthoscelides obtectus]
QIQRLTDCVESLNAQVFKLTSIIHKTVPNVDSSKTAKRRHNSHSSDLHTETDEDTQGDLFTPVRRRKVRLRKTEFPPLPTKSPNNKHSGNLKPSVSVPSTASTSQPRERPLSASTQSAAPVIPHVQSDPLAGCNSSSLPSSGSLNTQAQSPRQVRITPIVLRDATKWRTLNYSFVSLGVRIERAVAVDAGIRIIPKTEDDYRRIIRLFKEENIPHHTFPLPTEHNIHAVIRGIPASTTEQEVKGELEQKGYAPFHIIRLKRNGGVLMPLMVVILPKTEKSQQVFNEHELLGPSIRVEVQKNSRLIGQCHRCQKYGHAQSYCTAPPKCLKCTQDHMTQMCPQTGQEVRRCANSPTCRFTPRRNLQVIAQRRAKSYADAARDDTSTAPAVSSSSTTTQNVDLTTALRSLQQIISP